MTLRKSVVPAALAFAGCLTTESEPPPALEETTYQTPVEGGSCEVERVTYRLRGELQLEAEQEAARDKSVTRGGALLVTVAESSSLVECSDDRVRIAMPGAELHTAAFDADERAFAVDVPGAVIGGHRPALWVRALVDENDNGTCDDGELVGAVELEAAELDELEIALTRDGCPWRS